MQMLPSFVRDYFQEMRKALKQPNSGRMSIAENSRAQVELFLDSVNGLPQGFITFEAQDLSNGSGAKATCEASLMYFGRTSA